MLQGLPDRDGIAPDGRRVPSNLLSASVVSDQRVFYTPHAFPKAGVAQSGFTHLVCVLSDDLIRGLKRLTGQGHLFEQYLEQLVAFSKFGRITLYVPVDDESKNHRKEDNERTIIQNRSSDTTDLGHREQLSFTLVNRYVQLYTIPGDLTSPARCDTL